MPKQVWIVTGNDYDDHSVKLVCKTKKLAESLAKKISGFEDQYIVDHQDWNVLTSEDQVFYGEELTCILVLNAEQGTIDKEEESIYKKWTLTKPENPYPPMSWHRHSLYNKAMQYPKCILTVRGYNHDEVRETFKKLKKNLLADKELWTTDDNSL